MKTTMFKTVALVAVLSLSTLAAHADDALKIGYVNSERVLRESNLAKAAQTKLMGEFSKREKDLADLDAKIRAAADKLDKDAPTLSDGERTKRQRDIADQSRDLQRRQRELQEDETQRKNEELSAIVDKANKAVKQIFDSGKYDLILQDAAVFVGPRVDITQKVLDALNAQK